MEAILLLDNRQRNDTLFLVFFFLIFFLFSLFFSLVHITITIIQPSPQTPNQAPCYTNAHNTQSVMNNFLLQWTRIGSSFSTRTSKKKDFEHYSSVFVFQ